jgi:arylsulfatase A-like enzyme
VFVGCGGPHDPYYVPQRFLDMYDLEDIRLPPNFADEMRDKPNFYRRTRDLFSQLSEREHREAIRHFLAYCSYEDELFGRLLDALDRLGIADDTLVLYCSDHGDYMGEHGLWAKGLPCFRGAYHVPMVMRWRNGVANPGRSVDELVSLADIAPTFLDIAGIDAGREFAGCSLVPFLRDETPAEWRELLFTQSNGNELYGIQRSVFSKDVKFVYNGFDYDELYDLRTDPHELRNVVSDPEYKDVVRGMMRRIWQFSHETGDTCTNPYIMVRFAQYGPAEAFRE